MSRVVGAELLPGLQVVDLATCCQQPSIRGDGEITGVNWHRAIVFPAGSVPDMNAASLAIATGGGEQLGTVRGEANRAVPILFSRLRFKASRQLARIDLPDM